MTGKKGKIVDNVRELLSKYPQTRGNDKLLIVAYWRHFDGLHILDMEFVNKATPSESITRARRLIQSNGEFLADEETVKSRRKRESNFKKAIKEGDVI